MKSSKELWDEIWHYFWMDYDFAMSNKKLTRKQLEQIYIILNPNYHDNLKSE